MAGIDASTVLLLQMNGDRSDSQHPTTYNTGVKLDTTVKKFGYSSVYFTGGNYIDVPNHADWAFGTNDFTIDFWVRFDSFNGTGIDCLVATADFGSGSDGWSIHTQQTTLVLRAMYSGGWNIEHVITHTLTTNTWFHIALVKSSGSYQFYIQGTAIGSSYSNATSITSTHPIRIGSNPTNPAAAVSFNGFIDELRISDTVRYSGASFPVPTIEHSSDANTLYLNHFEGDISDGGDSIEISGAPTINATQSKWHGSIYLSGSGYMIIPSYAEVFTGDLTIDFWTNTTLEGSTLPHFISNYTFPYTYGFYCNLNPGGEIDYFIKSDTGSLSLTNQGTTVNDGSWHHIAWVRSGMASNNCTLYIDGDEVHTGTLTGTIEFSYDLLIGAQEGYTPSRNLTGYMDEIRISNTARWTTEFDVPVDPYSRFEYAIAGDIGLDSNVALYNPTTLELITYESVTAPSYLITVGNNSEVNVVAIPTDDSNNAKIFRDVIPEII